MPDPALGYCDMVLAVSEDTINYQFEQLWKRGLIRQSWKVLVREPQDGPRQLKSQEDKDFDETLSAWQEAQATIAGMFAEGKFEEFGKATAVARSAGHSWDYGWSASVAAPQIAVLAGDTHTLLFSVSFRSGTLLSCPDVTGPVRSWDLAGSVYSFRVPVGRVQITSTAKILTAEGRNQADQAIRDSGLTESDFSIEALFLDFENADIASFDAAASRFPGDATTAIQSTVIDYFKLVIAGEPNPFVLGYALNVKQIAPREALFQPNSVRFSTSYGAKPGYSAVNFLMTGAGRSFSEGQQVGVLPQSLLEGVSLDSTLDGVFAIDWPLFESLLVSPFVSAIAGAVATEFPGAVFTRTGQQWTLSATTSSSTTVSEPPSDLFEDTLLVSEQAVTSSLSLATIMQGLQLECTVDYKVQIRVQPWVLIWGRRTDYEALLSTSGRYRSGPSGDGRPGCVSLLIRPGAQGAVDFVVGPSTAPQLGYEREPTKRYEGGGGTAGAVLAMWNHYGGEDLAKGALDAASQLGEIVSEVLTSIDRVIRSLTTGKVILPLGQLYTFKQIRLSTHRQTDENAVLMNVSYAPVTS